MPKKKHHHSNAKLRRTGISMVGYPQGLYGWGGWGAAIGWTAQDPGCLSGAQFGNADSAGATTGGDAGAGGASV